MSRPTQDRVAQLTGITQVDDATLVEAYLEYGDAASFSELVRRHQIPVYRLMTALLPDPDRAEAACEEAFVRAAQRLPDRDFGSELGPWLAGIAKDVVEEFSAQEIPAAAALGVDDTLAAGSGRDVLRGAVRRALDQLNPEERSVLMLVELHGEPLDRAAATLGVPPSTIRERLASARKRFAAVFEQGEPSSSPQEEASDSGAESNVTQEQTEAHHEFPGYEIRDVLGEGGMGRIYRVIHLASGEQRALKVLLPELASAAGVQARFEREAHVSAVLEHPHIVRVHEFAKTPGGAPYMAMEVLAKETLAHRLRCGAIPKPDAVSVMHQLLEALGYLHSLRIVHRDIKPENIMFAEDSMGFDGVKLVDLGIARAPSRLSKAPSSDRLTAAGMTLGTPAYIAPEQALGTLLDGRADLYAATVVFFEMLTGRLPFDAEDAGTLLAKHVSMPAPALRQRGLRSSVELETLVARGLSKQPYDRYDNAGEYLEALADVCGEELAAASRIP